VTGGVLFESWWAFAIEVAFLASWGFLTLYFWSMRELGFTWSTEFDRAGRERSHQPSPATDLAVVPPGTSYPARLSRIP
jgi:hypothetical protein